MRISAYFSVCSLCLFVFVGIIEFVHPLPQSLPGPDPNFNCTRPYNYFHEKHALLTGGSYGMGRAATEAMADAGIKVFVLDKRAAPYAHSGVTFFEVDIRDDKEVDKALQKIRKKSGVIDYYIMNAGEGLTALTQDATHKEMLDFIDNNAIAHFALFSKLRSFMPRSNDSRVIATSSIGNELSFPYITSGLYGLTKDMLLHFLRDINVEYFGQFQVSAIRPDGVNTSYAKHTEHTQENTCPQQVKLMDEYQVDALAVSTTQPTMYGELVMQILCMDKPHGVYTMATTLDESFITAIHNYYCGDIADYTAFARALTANQIFDPETQCKPNEQAFF